MKAIDTARKHRRVLQLLRNIEQIMEADGESNWIRGIRSAIFVLEASQQCTEDQAHALAEVASIYSTMNSGPGGFGDYFIWRDDLDDRRAANRDFEATRDELWRLLNG